MNDLVVPALSRFVRSWTSDTPTDIRESTSAVASFVTSCTPIASLSGRVKVHHPAEVETNGEAEEIR